MMTREEDTARKMAIAKALLGKTTGASKGSKPAPKPKVKPSVGKGKVGLTWEKKF